MRRIGFIGLGKMGLRMAARLAEAGFRLNVHDTNDEVRPRALALGTEWVISAAQVASQSEVVFVSLPTPEVVERVLTGPDGVGQGGAVRIVIDTSTTGPVTSSRVAAHLANKGIALIDAPVSGGTIGAENGSLTIMVSGESHQYDAVRDLLQVLGKNLFYLGAQAGQAQLMKIINNTLCATATLSAFEGLVLGSKAGLDARAMLDVINASSGRSFATEVKIPQCILERNFPPRFTTSLLHKDVRLCLNEGERMGVPMWVSDAARQVLSFAISQGDGPIDYGNVIKHYEAWAGAVFGSPASPPECIPSEQEQAR